MLKSWNGDKVIENVERATLHAMDETVTQAVIRAKRNHPGWKNRTGIAEGSIRVIRFARRAGAHIEALWGSTGVNYMLPLEFKRGSALRSAGDVEHRKLAGRIKKALIR